MDNPIKYKTQQSDYGTDLIRTISAIEINHLLEYIGLVLTIYVVKIFSHYVSQ